MIYTNYFFVALISATLFLTSCGSKEKKTAQAKEKERVEAAVDSALAHRLHAFAQRPRVNGRFGLYVWDLTTDREVFADSADVAQPIASCTKLLSGVAALHVLGTDYKYNTDLLVRGTMKGDTLVGNIALKAGLDPIMQAPDFKMFADSLKKAGVKHVKGYCLLDLTLRDKVKAEEHWYPWDLSFSKYGIFFKGPDGIKRALKAALANDGIRVSDGFVVDRVKGFGWRTVCHYERGLQETTQRMWKHSSNIQATSLFYTLGHQLSQPRSVAGLLNSVAYAPSDADRYADKAVKYVRTFLCDTLKQHGKGLSVHDGCGLCTHNHLSPRALVAVLRYGYHDKHIFKALMDGLAVTGTDGTLRALISDPRVRGRVHAKTGTLSHPYGISSLSGYVQGTDGHWYAFSLLCSQMSVLDAHVLQRRLCLALCGIEKR